MIRAGTASKQSNFLSNVVSQFMPHQHQAIPADDFKLHIRFGPHISIRDSQVFLWRKLTFGMVNLKPFKPRHVLVCTKREVQNIVDLEPQEVFELFKTG